MTSDRATETFIDDDRGYRLWLRAHPDGYVLNSYRHPTQSYLTT